MIRFYAIYFILMLCKLVVSYEFLLSSITGEVENNNFVYYSMSYEGTVLLKLISLSGDCDLYVSQNSKKPSYEPESNCLSSVTCGIDSVIIPKSFKRPVGIGIFGHPSNDGCSYSLAFYRINDSHDLFNFNPYIYFSQLEVSRKLSELNIDSSLSNSGKESFLQDFLSICINMLISLFNIVSEYCITSYILKEFWLRGRTNMRK